MSREVKKKSKASRSSENMYELVNNLPTGHKFPVQEIFHCPLVSFVWEFLENNPAALHFHFEPFHHIWKSHNGQGCEEHVFDEIYTSDAFLKEHNKLQNSSLEPGCKHPHVILALMFMSDATHLAQFGDVSLWPVYLAFGNQRKYEHCQSSMNVIHHVADLQKVKFIFLLLCNKVANIFLSFLSSCLPM